MKKLSVLALVVVTAAGCTQPKPDEGPGGTPASSASTTGANGDKSGGDKGAAPANASASNPPPAASASNPAAPAASTAPPPASTTPPAETKPPTLKTGMIMLNETYTTDYTYSVLAAFTDATGVTPAAPTVKCTTTTLTDCDLTTCDVPKPTDPAPTQPLDPPEQTDPPQLPSAGDIAVSGLDQVTLSPDDTGLYTPASGTSALFKVDTAIKITAAGAQIPKFDHTLTGPSQIGMTAPVWPTDGTNLQVDRTKNLVLSWAYGTTGTVEVSMSAVSIGTSTIKTASLACHYNASAGTATIASSTLGKLPADDSGTMSIDVRSIDTFDAGDWTLTATAIRPAKVGDGAVPAIVTLK
jgi:hypothetical protein